MVSNETVDSFKEKQQKAYDFFQSIDTLVSRGIEIGIEIPHNVHKKLNSVLNMVQNSNCLKVALIGGFSEGKTSIAAAWMEKYDKSTMKISQQESSDEVNIYMVDDEIELIDTPGLFGLKEKFNVDFGIVEKYKEITKKYVSEAHLVLYVMDPTNPIKESHKEDLEWLFRILNLLPRTVFVLSKFDEVADIEDEWDYRETLKIKKENIIQRLKQLINLTSEEEKNLEIVAVSSNPYGNGIDYWLDNLEEFKEISHIDKLQQATKNVMEGNGGYFPLVYSMQKSVIEDIFNNLNNVEVLSGKMKENVENFIDGCSNLSSDVKVLRDNIVDVQSKLITYLTRYFSDLILQARGCGMDTIQGFIEAEIGKNGEIIYANLQNEFSRQTRTIESKIDKISIEFNANVNQFDSIATSMGKVGLDFLSKPGVMSAKNILSARDGIVSLGKMLGTDIGGFLKFKPWGATNLAKSFSNVLAGIGIVLEVWNFYKEKEAAEKFRKSVEDLVENLSNIRSELLTVVQAEDFIDNFFPEYIKLKEDFENKSKEIEEYRKKQKSIDEWCDSVKILAAKANSI